MDGTTSEGACVLNSALLVSNNRPVLPLMRKTHFGFETVDETQKAQRGKLGDRGSGLALCPPQISANSPLAQPAQELTADQVDELYGHLPRHIKQR